MICFSGVIADLRVWRWGVVIGHCWWEPLCMTLLSSRKSYLIGTAPQIMLDLTVVLLLMIDNASLLMIHINCSGTFQHWRSTKQHEKRPLPMSCSCWKFENFRPFCLIKLRAHKYLPNSNHLPISNSMRYFSDGSALDLLLLLS